MNIYKRNLYTVCPATGVIVWIVMIKSLRQFLLIYIYKIVKCMHKKMSHPDEIQNTDVITKQFRNVFAKAAHSAVQP